MNFVNKKTMCQKVFLPAILFSVCLVFFWSVSTQTVSAATCATPPLSLPSSPPWLVVGTNIGASCSATLSADKGTYAPGETMTVSYSATVAANTGWARNIYVDCDIDLGSIDGTVTIGNTYANVADAGHKSISGNSSGTFDWLVPAAADGCHSLPVGLHLYGGGQPPVGSFDGSISDNLKFNILNPSTPGTINVTSNIAGASYTITGPATLPGSGAFNSHTSQPTGVYTITWNAVPGYTTPGSDTQTLTDGGTISFSGNYSLIVAPPVTINVSF